MAEKIQRHTGDLPMFAENGDRTTFGTGIEDDSLDGNLTPQFETGWVASPNVLPPAKHFNAVNYTTTRLLAYLMQNGVAEYDAQQTYFIGGICKDASGVLFRSLTDNNVNNPLNDEVHWINFTSTIMPSQFANYSRQADYYGDGSLLIDTQNILQFKKDGTPIYQQMPFGTGYRWRSYSPPEREGDTVYTNPYTLPIIVYISHDDVGLALGGILGDGSNPTNSLAIDDITTTLIVLPSADYYISFASPNNFSAWTEFVPIT